MLIRVSKACSTELLASGYGLCLDVIHRELLLDNLRRRLTHIDMHTKARVILRCLGSSDEAANITALREIARFKAETDHQLVHGAGSLISRIVDIDWRTRRISIAGQAWSDHVEGQIFRRVAFLEDGEDLEKLEEAMSRSQQQ